MMRDSHLTTEEIIKYMDTSDLSEDYLLFMEEVMEHMSRCHFCRHRLQKALTVESICEEGGLAAGLRLLAKEEKIKNRIREEVNNGSRTEILTGILKKIRKKKDDDIWEVDPYAEQYAAYESVAQQYGIPVNIERRFKFSMMDLIRENSADLAGGSNTADGSSEPQVVPEICGDKLIFRISKEVVQELNWRTGQMVRVKLSSGNELPIVKDAVWDEADERYVAEFDVNENIGRFVIDVYVEDADL